MAEEKKIITKSDWTSSFTLIGKAKINDYTFKINETSEKSNWIYNSINLGIDCGEKHGVVYCEAMGGYSGNGKNVIYCHGKDSNGADDFKNQITVDWEDRFDDSILENVGDLSFIVVGLEKTSKDNTFYKKFLSMYDAISYIKEHLTSDMVVNVKGQIKYSEYKGKVQAKKQITSIALSKIDSVDKYSASFTQSILIDSDSASLKNIDKDKGVMYLDGIVLDYVKEIDGIEVKGQYPYHKQFEFLMNLENEEQCKAIMNKLFKVKRGSLNQITFDGSFVEGGAVVMPVYDDLPEDIKSLVDMGISTKEEVLAKCASNGNREQRMILKKPIIKNMLSSDGETRVPVLQIFADRYKEEDISLDYLAQPESDESDTEVGNDDLEWLKALS